MLLDYQNEFHFTTPSWRWPLGRRSASSLLALSAKLAAGPRLALRSISARSRLDLCCVSLVSLPHTLNHDRHEHNGLLPLPTSDLLPAQNASFLGANLAKANFFTANLRGANFTGATLTEVRTHVLPRSGCVSNVSQRESPLVHRSLSRPTRPPLRWRCGPNGMN